jgi:predicted dinucleotide-binding enzyme
VQQKMRGAKVVRASNTHFATHMDTGRVDRQRLTVFAAADDAGAKNQVLQMARAIGFDALDAGPLQNARYLEPLGYLNIQLGYVVGLAVKIGLRLFHG